jgi:Bifunctional DNA primase/polymerase, N-terminal
MSASINSNEASPPAAALAYAHRFGWRVFPVGADKKPLTTHGLLDASTDPATIRKWFRRWPRALVALATGAGSGVVALDIDISDSVDGIDSLEALGVTLPFTTAEACTPRGGFHVLFRHPGERVRNSAGKLGPGLDVRGDGGYIVLPPGPGRCWGRTPDQVDLAPFPAWARMPEPVRPPPTSVPRGDGCSLTRYGEAALDSAVENIVNAPNGQQEATLNKEAFCIGQLVAAGHIPESLAEDALRLATQQMLTYDPRRPWDPRQLERKISAALTAGASRPRRGVRS